MAWLRVTHRLIDQLFDPLCVPPGAIRNVKGDNIVRASLKHLIRAIGLQIALVRLLSAVGCVKLRPVANLSPLVEVRFAGTRVIEAF